MKTKITPKQKTKMELFKKAFKASLLNVSVASKQAGISRQTYHNWLDKFDTFKKEIEDIEEEVYDAMEQKIKQMSIAGNTTMMIFFAKTKMKNRGYIETVEHKLDEDAGIDIVVRTGD